MLTRADSKLLHALKSRSGREKHAAFVVEGVRVVEEAVAAGFDLQFAVASPTLEDNERGRALAEKLSQITAIRRVTDLREIAETETPQGVLAVARIPTRSLDDVVMKDRALLLVLDAVQDPGNVGTLIRAADAFAADAVIALQGTVDYWSSKVVRAAAGATFHLPLINATDAEVWKWLRGHDVELCGAEMNGETAAEAKLGRRVALFAGNEGGGLREGTRSRLDKLLAIPMPGNAESLNVAVAAGILLYELSKRT
ncbi:MAG TPA: RNA methyltransferase [Longimicrobiales bacterium]|nr:RNA methyltransferase [Longimicrobiales bacterium]